MAKSEYDNAVPLFARISGEIGSSTVRYFVEFVLSIYAFSSILIMIRKSHNLLKTPNTLLSHSPL